MRFHEDERRTFWGDLFELPNGDVNIVHLKPGITIAWHRHQRQDDRLFLVDGKVHVQTIRPNGIREQWWLCRPDDRVVFVPRGSWHGYSTPDGGTLLQFNNNKYDGTDEERMSLDEMPWIPTP